MKYDPFKHRRRSIRLRGYDYRAAGAYFVTICLQGGLFLLGDVVEGEMEVNAAGEMVLEEWIALTERFQNIKLDAFIVMPNHVHGIIQIRDSVERAGEDDRAPISDSAPEEQRAPTRGAPTGDKLDMGAGVDDDRPKIDLDVGVPLVGTQDGKVAERPTLGKIIGEYKSITTNRYIHAVQEQDWPPFPGRLWQRNYYERIIRNERAVNVIRAYIDDNPTNWPTDEYNPAGVNRKK